MGNLKLKSRHRLLCGDSTSEADVAKLMDGETAGVCFTSPPYADQRTYDGCDLTLGKITKFITVAAGKCELLFVNLGIQRKNGAVIPYWNDYIDAANKEGLKLVGWLIWDRGSPQSIGQQTAMFPIEHEFVFAFAKRASSIIPTIKNKAAGENKTSKVRDKNGNLGAKNSCVVRSFRELGTVVRIPNVSNNNDHPAQFPVALPTEFIKTTTGIAYEPFCGSGTTLIACEQLDRRCFAIEISPNYCDVIVARWEALTGQTAVKQSGDE